MRMKMLIKRAKRSKTEMVTTTRLSGILGSESITEAREKSHDNIGSHPQFQCCDRDRQL